jgi:hypothetical protein
MKRILITSVLLCILAGSIFAAPIENVTSSAFMPGDSAIVNLDFIDPFGLPLYDAVIKARPAGANFDSTILLSHVPDDPYYLTTFEGVMHFAEPAGPIEFYGRIEADTLVATQSYKNSSNQFPPSPILYAPLADDAVGDTTPGTLGQFLDLTGAAMTYSDTRLYARLSNVGGGWPGNQGLTTYFVYGVLLLNPDTLSLTVTAMVNVNVPLLFQPGLYTLNLADTSFQRVADISYQSSGSNLHLACDISDLISTPNFPTWPPQSGYIIAMGFTATVTLSGVPSFNDYTYPSVFMPQTQYLNVSGNQPPVLSNLAFDLLPNIGINAHCDFYDADDNLPVLRQLFFDRGVFDMGSLDHSYDDTATFNYALPWPGTGYHYYFFVFSDGVDTVRTPWDSLYINPEGVDEDIIPTDFALFQNYPNPFNARTKIDFNLAQAAEIELSVFDINGHKVGVLADGRLETGPHSVIWNGQNNDGQIVSSGIYFYKLDINGNRSATKEMIFLK